MTVVSPRFAFLMSLAREMTPPTRKTTTTGAKSRSGWKTVPSRTILSSESHAARTPTRLLEAVLLSNFAGTKQTGEPSAMNAIVDDIVKEKPLEQRCR